MRIIRIKATALYKDAPADRSQHSTRPLYRRLKLVALILLAFFLSSAPLVALIPTPVYAATSGDYTYTVIDESLKTAQLNRIANASGVVYIPATIDGYTITSLKNTIVGSIFTSAPEAPPNTAVTSVVIPDSVTSIGSRVFAKCIGITSVTIPDSITSIDFYAFCKTNLTTVNIPARITSLGNWVFNDCASLTGAYFYGNAPTSFGENVFEQAANFKIFFINGKSGWTMPTWNSYSTEAFATNGDVNNDNIVSINDVVMTVNFVLAKITPTGIQCNTADYNSDGSITINDVVAIVNKVLGR
jgi:hypothetical protein